MENLYRAYRERVSFYFVYVREAHSADGRQAAANLRDGVVYNTPRSLQERQSIASNCVSRLGLSVPCLVDTLDDPVQQLYQGGGGAGMRHRTRRPDRLPEPSGSTGRRPPGARCGP